ncbi:AraC family transcriptional regulator [Leeia oryzae]|uniref:AraC family transcriptional regulator n=1 Tax=Leeia oryzae TaxID=356662 RepID=UPI000381D193|nr:helix-turn-helix transcriptional regulator [Leeia oryzae]
MEQVLASDWEHIPEDVLAIENRYPQGHQLSLHQHLRHQLLFAAHGMMKVITADGSWIVPPHRAVWIPAGTQHAVSMLTAVTTCSLYIRPDAQPLMPARCTVIDVSQLLHQLLIEAPRLRQDYTHHIRETHLMGLLLAELPRMPHADLNLPLPANYPAMSELCLQFIQQPDIHQPMSVWYTRLNLSRRTFCRHFRQHTGIGFQQWIQQACVLSALPRLINGEAITRIALDLGFEHPGAFTTMFRRLTGYAPSVYLRWQRNTAD